MANGTAGTTNYSAEPSMSKTIDWLTEKLSGFESAVYSSPRHDIFRELSYRYKIVSFSVHNGRLEYRTEEKMTGNLGESVHLLTVTVPLDELSARCDVIEMSSKFGGVPYQPSVYGVSLSSSSSNRIKLSSPIVILPEGKKSVQTEMVSETQLRFTNRELANRVSNALEHLIKLSGGKEEVF